jgi:hypothetical protein
LEHEPEAEGAGEAFRAREERFEPRCLSMEERCLGRQHDSSPRVSKARQMHPIASRVAA